MRAEGWRALVARLRRPPMWGIALVFMLAVGCSAGSVILVINPQTGRLFAVLSVVLYAAAALFLSYSIYLLVVAAPYIKGGISSFFSRFALTRGLRGDFAFRTLVLGLCSLSLSVVYALYHGVMGVLVHSAWYGSLASYYLMLVLLRGGVMWSYRRHRGGAPDVRRRAARRACRNCGAWLLVLSLVLGVMVTLTLSDHGFVYGEYTIYVAALYAFYKITMSIINGLRAKKQDDDTVRAIRAVNLADATVSILALQTAMFHQFGGGADFALLMNLITGGAVCLFTAVLGVWMLISAAHKKKEIVVELEDGKERI